MQKRSEDAETTSTAPTPRRWTSEENIFLWEMGRKPNVSWEKIAEALDRTVAGCRSHFARLRNRNKYLAQNRCHGAGHTAHEIDETCCVHSDCDNYYGRWKWQTR